MSGAVGLGAAMDYVDSLGLEAIAAHEAAGCDELLLFPCAADLDQLDRFALARTA